MAGELEFSEQLRVCKEESEESKKTSDRLAFFRIWPYRILLLIFLWLELFFTAGCLITLLNLPVNIYLMVCVGAVCGLVWLIFFSMRSKWRYLFLSACIAAATFLFFRHFELVREGFFYVGNAFNRLFYNYYKSSLFYFRTSGEQDLCCAVFLVFLLQPVAACYARTLFRARAKFASTVFLAFAALFGLALGLIPKHLYFIGAFFSALLQFAFAQEQSEYLVQGGKIRKEYGDGQKRRAQIAFLFCALVAVIGLVASHFIDSDYYGSLNLREKKQKLQIEMEQIAAMPVWQKIASTFTDLSLFSGGEKDGTARIGGLNSGRFSRAGQISFDNVTALFVSLPEMECSVYLRGYTGARYTREGWEKLNTDAVKEYDKIRTKYEISSQEQGYRLMELIYHNKGPVLKEYFDLGDGVKISRGQMQVEYVTANRNFVYTPYYINPLERGNYQYEQDGYLTSPDREDVHDYTFLIPSLEFLYRFGELTDQRQKIFLSSPIYDWSVGMDTSLYWQFSNAYRDFVYKYYTEVPKENEEVKKLLSGAANASIIEKIRAVQLFLSQYEYTLAPGEMPLDADFVNYFLFENKKGYCVHFASSAVLMLRSLGVPARYAEGYLITQEDIALAPAITTQTISEHQELLRGTRKRSLSTRVVLQKCVDVRDYTAHAWVEVYLDEIGWVPVEMTSGYMENPETGQRPAEIMQEVSHLPSPTPVPTREATPTPLPTNTPTPVAADPAEMPGGEEVKEDLDKYVEANTSKNSESLQGTTPSLQAKASPSPTEGNKSDKSERKINNNYLRKYFAVLPLWVRILLVGSVLSLCVICVLLLRYRIVWRIRSRNRARKNQVLWYYAQMERILHRMGLIPSDTEGYEEFAWRVKESGVGAAVNFAGCQRMALTADFGREHITKEQTAFLAENYEKMRLELFRNCKRLRKYYLKFIKLY